MKNRLGIACQSSKGHRINGKIIAAGFIDMQTGFAEISCAYLPSSVSVTDVMESDQQGQQQSANITLRATATHSYRPSTRELQMCNHLGLESSGRNPICCFNQNVKAVFSKSEHEYIFWFFFLFFTFLSLFLL